MTLTERKSDLSLQASCSTAVRKIKNAYAGTDLDHVASALARDFSLKFRSVPTNTNLHKLAREFQ